MVSADTKQHLKKILPDWLKSSFYSRENRPVFRRRMQRHASSKRAKLPGDTPPTCFLAQGVVDVDVHGPVCDVQQHGVVLPAELVGALDGHVIPVGPVHPVFEDGDGEGVRDLLHHRVSTGAIQLAVSGREAGIFGSELGLFSPPIAQVLRWPCQYLDSFPMTVLCCKCCHQSSETVPVGFTFIQTLLLQNILMVNLRHPKMIHFFSFF